MKNFCFTVDDNIRCLKELSEGRYGSLFEHPYFSMYKRLHEKYGVKIQLNLFYENGDFKLSEMTAEYKEQWRQNSDWLKLSFHSRAENGNPYESSGYDEVFRDCRNVQEEIVRFASPDALGKTTTIHCCRATSEGLRALKDNGVQGLLGLYGTQDAPRRSYRNTEEEGTLIRAGNTVSRDGMAFAGIDVILNLYSKEEILLRLQALKHRDLVKVMIHEQYFYPDYPKYQPNFEEKLDATFRFLSENGFYSVFLEDTIRGM